MDSKLRNRILLYLVLAGVLAYGLLELSGRKPVPKISAVAPMRENLVSSINSNGKVEPVAPYVILARLDTFVKKVFVTEGQQVKKGQLLLELDVKDAAAQLAEARVKLLRAQEDVRNAKSGGKPEIAAQVAGDLAKAVAERDRLQKNRDALVRLMAEQAATKDELATNDLALTKAQAEVTRLQAVKQEFDRGVRLDTERTGLQVQQAQSEVDALEEKVRDGHITAPVNGTLYSLPAKTGDFVKLELLPNINVNLRINSRERIGVLSVPRGAVEAEGGRRFVFVVRKNQLGVKSTLEKREIHVGIADATNYEVVSGLQEGELVALPGDVDLRDGMDVIVVTTEAGNFQGRVNG